jgi:hypothetical protein
MVERLVDSAWWATAFASEREAQRKDSANPSVAAEDAEWQEAVEDGIE